MTAVAGNPGALDAMEAGNDLTRRQLLLWLGQKRHPGIPLYNMVVEFEIHGSLDAGRLGSAFTTLLGASDALRSVFSERDGVARRGVLSTTDFALPLVDFSYEQDPRAAYRRAADSRAARELDLNARCFDSVLFRLGEEHYVWWFCQHHLIGDGASIGLIYRFVAEHYADPEKNGVLGSAAAAYAQELSYMSSKRASGDEAFWAPRRLRGVESSRYYAYPKHENARHVERISVALDTDKSERLRAVAKRQGFAALSELSWVSFLETVLFAFLYRITGKREHGLGIPLRNRHTPAAKAAVGCFMEVVPIRVEVNDEDTFSTLLERVKSDTAAALAHGQLCLSNPDNRPLFEVTLNFHTEKYSPFAGFPTDVGFSTGLHALGPISDEAPHHWEGVDGFNLQCHDYKDEGRFTLYFDFGVRHFDAEQRARAVGHFMKLFDRALEDSDARIASVDLLSESERSRLEALNVTWVERDTTRTVVSAFEAEVRKSPDAVALRFEDRVLTYAALDDRATRIARELHQLGVGPDVLVGVLLSRSTDLVAALLGTLKAGGAYVPLDPSHPVARNAVVLEDAKPRVLVTTRALLAGFQLSTPAHVLCIEELEEVLSGAVQPERLASPKPEDLAYVLFTSGSTGRPKGVAISHAALSNFLSSMQKSPGLSAGDRVLATTTVSFDIAGLELYLPLVTGASIDLVDSETAKDPFRLSAAMARCRPNLFQATPATYRMLLDIGSSFDPNLKALCGGEALSLELARELRPRVGELWNMYGPTETTIWSALEKMDADNPGPVSIGLPIQNTSIHVLNSALVMCPIGVIGELYIGGEGLARGYYDRPELTEERFVPDPFSTRPGARLYRTGDLGRRLPDGRLECLGREDSQVKIHGYRIELGEIETALLKWPSVASALVLPREDKPGEKYLTAYVTARADAELDLDGLRSFLRESLPRYMLPTAFTVLDSWPLTPAGKIDRKALPRPDFVDQGRSYEPPQDDLEAQLAAIFEKLLHVSRVGRHDGFFDLGGHSVLAARLLVELNAIVRQGVSFGTVFQRPTVAELAEVIRESGTSDDALVIPLNPGATGLPLFCVCGIQIYKDLAQALGPSQSVYGVYLPAEDNGIATARENGKLFTVEELAKGYLEAIRRQQPQGPYCLGGLSFGGVLAYEMAQQLIRAGEEVALLVLIDSTLPRALKWRPVRWTLAHLAEAMKEGPGYVARRAAQLTSGLLRRFPGIRAREPEAVSESGAVTLGERIGAYLQATARYDEVIRPYAEEIMLFRACFRSDFVGYDVDPWLGWRDLVPNLEVYEASGDHLGVLKAPAVDLIAAPLRAALLSLRPPTSTRGGRRSAGPSSEPPAISPSELSPALSSAPPSFRDLGGSG